jgi:hypothetical protein
MSFIEIFGKILLTFIVVVNFSLFFGYISVVFINYLKREKYNENDSIDI